MSLHLSARKRALLARMREEPDAASARIPRLSGAAVASHAERRLWVLEQAFGDGPYPYNQSLSLSLTGPLDAGALEAALDEIVRRHAALRTSFAMRDGRLAARVEEPQPVRLHLVDLAGLAGAPARRAAIDGLAREEAGQRFDLAGGALLRASLIRWSPVEHELLLTFHHIAVDGLSLTVLVPELAALYGARVERRSARLPELAAEYRDFAAWQETRLRGERLARDVAYWREALAGELPVLELPLDRPHPPTRRFRGGREEASIPARVMEAVHEVGRRHDATLFMTLLAAYVALLHRYSGQRDILVGSPSSGRVHRDVAGLVGCFINQLVHRAEVDVRASFSDLLRQVSRSARRAMAHEELPFDLLVAELGLRRERDQNPAFQTLFGLQEVLPGCAAGGVAFDGAVMHSGGTAKLDLELNVFQSPSGLRVCFDYDTDVFDASTIAGMVRHWARLVEEVARDPGAAIGRVPLLDGEERRRVLIEWNDTAADYPADRCVHEMFEAQAARTPDRIAVVFEGASLSYRELDERSNQVARHLRRLGVSREVPVGLFLERSLEMIVGLLGVLKAGGAYVPLDPSAPRQRLAFVLDETGAPVLLTQRRLDRLLPAGERRVVHLDAGWGHIARESSEPLGGCAAPDSLIYIMYTSGSTGRPKGVMLEHRGVTNRVAAMQRAYVGPADVVLHKTPYTFDVAVGETFCPLVAGGRLVVARPDGHRDAAYLGRLIRDEGVTVAEFVPSMLQIFADEPGAADACRSLRLVIASGEALSRELQERFLTRSGAQLHNVYGPTEAGEVTAWPCARGTRGEAGTVPLGRPMANFRIHILDASGEPVPVGARGELFIGGVGLARGYLGRPDLTAERFVPDPVGAPGERLYRTGDVARRRADGVLEYLGRADAQVKIRGFRVEPGEIEAVLRRQDGVRDAIVVAREDRPGDRRLVAYAVAAGRQPSVEALRAAARDELPDYMVPSAFVLLDAWPLGGNGKLDRRALPPPDRAGAAPEAEGPDGPTELALAAIWIDLLGIASVGALEDFFELGGDSLLVVQVVSRIREDLGVEIQQQDLFEAPTVRELAAVVDRAAQERAIDQLGSIPATDDRVAQARAILSDPSASVAARAGARRFLEALGRG